MTSRVEEMLTRQGKLYRALLPQQTPEETEREHRDFMDRLRRTTDAVLDAAESAACALCHQLRPREPGEPRYYPPEECVNVRQPWHYHRDWTRGTNQRKKQREARRHRRRVRRGRLPRTRPASGGTA